MPHKPGFIHTGKDENSWNYFELPFGSGADYKRPIALEDLPYTPAILGEMLENKEKERELEIEGLGKGKLVISKQNKNKPFFYPEQSPEYIEKASRQLQLAEIGGNLPIITSPLTTLGKGVPKIIQSKRQQKIDLAVMKAQETKNLSKNAINLEKTLDGVFQMPSQQVRDIIRIAKKNKISYKKAEEYVNLKNKGVLPSQTLNPGTNAGLIEGNLPLNRIMARLKKIGKDRNIPDDMMMIDLGLPSFGESRRNESVMQFRNRLFNQAGFRRNEDGDFIFDDRLLIKNVKGDDRRTISQTAQTKPGQTVKRSFEKTRDATRLAFTDELGGYMRLTGSKPNLHHRFAAMISAPLYRGLALKDTPGSEWMELTSLLNEYNIYPGSPVTDPESLGGPKSNLEQIVTKGYNQKITLPDGTEKVIRRPAEPHDILHHQYYKELGLQDVEEGKTSWFDKRMYKITGSRQGRMEVAREYAEIVREGDRIIDEAMNQIRALFGNKTDPDYIVKLLMELVRTGKLKITGTNFRLKSIEKIVEIIRKEVQANLPLADEQEVLNIVEQYNLDYAQEIEAIDLLHNIADYNESMRVFGRRPPSITHSQHKRNIKRYMELIQTKLPLEIPVKEAKEQGLRTYTYKRVKPVPIENQLEIIFSDD